MTAKHFVGNIVLLYSTSGFPPFLSFIGFKMASTNGDDDKLHIAMFPWLAFGHMIPYLELGKQIAANGHRVSFISTPKNIDRLLKASPELEGLIDFVRIPLPPVDNLPEDTEATSDLPNDRIQYLKIAIDLLQEPVERFLESASVDWIMYDFASYWVGEIAARVGVRRAYFNIYIAATAVFLGPVCELMGGGCRRTVEDFTVAPPWIPFKSNLALRYHEMKRIFNVVEGNASKVTDLYRLGASVNNAEVIMMRSSYECEAEWLKVLEDIHKKPIFPVGQLPPSTRKQDEEKNDETWLSIKGWLDTQKKGSVVYIALGSEAKPTQAELTEIAFGLENSDLPFFWVFRNQLGEADPDRIELPQGFEARVKGRGFVCRSWAPQVSDEATKGSRALCTFHT